jgi:hypothetical protein
MADGKPGNGNGGIDSKLRRTQLIISIVAGLVAGCIPVVAGFWNVAGAAVKADAETASLRNRITLLENEVRSNRALFQQLGEIKGQTDAILKMITRLK